MKCKVCGYENAEDAVFCSSCGGKLEKVEEEKRFCKNCGAEVDGDFCSNCGAPVVKETPNSYKEVPEKVEETKRFCLNCGAEVEGQFCSNCGASVTGTDQVSVSKNAADDDFKSEDGETIGKSGFKRFLHYMTDIYDAVMGIIVVFALIGKLNDHVDYRLGFLILLIIPSFLFFGIMRLRENKYYAKHPYTSDLNRFTIAQIIGFSISLILLICILVVQPKQVELVKNSRLDLDESITIGEAFDQACSHEKWRCYTSEYHPGGVVEFTGKYNGMKVRIQFTEKDNDYEIVYAELEGEELSPLERGTLLAGMYGIDVAETEAQYEDDEVEEEANTAAKDVQTQDTSTVANDGYIREGMYNLDYPITDGVGKAYISYTEEGIWLSIYYDDFDDIGVEYCFRIVMPDSGNGTHYEGVIEDTDMEIGLDQREDGIYIGGSTRDWYNWLYPMLGTYTYTEPMYEVTVNAPDGYVNMREGEGTAFDVFTTINNGAILPVYEVDSTGSWLMIEYQDAIGWVAASQVTQ